MRSVPRIFGLIVVLVAVGLTIDYACVQAKERRVSHTIAQLGGRTGSIPAWPVGTEYRVTFTKALTSDELIQLYELNTLRGSVVVAFEDCELSSDQIREVIGNLPQCELFSVVNGTASRLAVDH